MVIYLLSLVLSTQLGTQLESETDGTWGLSSLGYGTQIP